MRMFLKFHACIRFSWWRHQMETFSRYWPFVREIQLSTVDSPHKGQWVEAWMSSLICAWMGGWVNNRWRHHDYFTRYSNRWSKKQLSTEIWRSIWCPWTTITMVIFYRDLQTVSFCPQYVDCRSHCSSAMVSGVLYKLTDWSILISTQCEPQIAKK